MGYTTRFTGSFKVSPPLTVPHFNELKALVENGVTDESAPSSYLQWEPTPDGEGLRWDGREKFYSYVEWLQWLIDTRLGPWGHEVSGSVRWAGESAHDTGVLVISANRVAQRADAKTVAVYVPLALIARHARHADDEDADDEDAAEEIAAHVVKSARLQGAL